MRRAATDIVTSLRDEWAPAASAPLPRPLCSFTRRGSHSLSRSRVRIGIVSLICASLERVAALWPPFSRIRYLPVAGDVIRLVSSMWIFLW